MHCKIYSYTISLINTCFEFRQICSDKKTKTGNTTAFESLFYELARAYQNVMKEQHDKKEFYGLRDFYRLVCSFVLLLKTTSARSTRVTHSSI